MTRSADPAGDPGDAEVAADLDALRGGAALLEIAADLVELRGPDALKLLQGLVTADVKRLAPGATARGFFTTGQGRILADFRLVVQPEACWLLLPKGSGDSLRAHLEKYKVASRVEIGAVADRVAFELTGPRALKALEMARSVLGDAAEAIAMASDSAGSGPRSFLLLKASDALPFATTWVRKAIASGWRKVSLQAAEIARIEDGELRFGVDFSGDNFPQETGREGEISYTKGCYLGQEVVARIHYRGGVQRLPRGLSFAGDGLPGAGSELAFEGRAVGRATSVARSPRFGAIGLGLLHQRGAAPGTRLEVAGGGSAEVVELPFGTAG